jgi:membrane protein insertase Oxa1/YidC/SpoIIIJ
MSPTSLFRSRILQGSRQANFRAFSTSPTNRFGGPIEITAELFRSVHDLTGLSYGLTIPLTALVLRTAITLPLAIYSQKKLNRRIELRPLFYHWGEIIGMQTAKQQKSRNVDLRNDKEALREVSLKVQSTVFLQFSKVDTCSLRNG